MKPVMKLSMRLVSKCHVCLQLKYPEVVQARVGEMILFGWIYYEVCCVCGNKVPPEKQSKRYIKRYNRYMRHLLQD